MKKQKNFLYRCRSGVSLLISIFLVAIIVLFSLTVSNVVITSVRQSANVNRANEAYYAAEGGLEEGLLENLNQGAGYTGVSTDIGYLGCDPNVDDCPLKATFKVQGQVPENTAYGQNTAYSGMYGLPTPGSGSAVEGCDPLKAFQNVPFNYNAADDTFSESSGGIYDATEHPCNWNRIKFGESLSIPLYVANGECTTNPDFICNPRDIGLNSLYVRVRTPCKTGEKICPGSERYTLDVNFGDPKVEGNDTIVDWQIVGTNASETETYIMQPIRDYDEQMYGGRSPSNSEIYESRINDLKSVTIGKFEVLFSLAAMSQYGDDIFADVDPPGNIGKISSYLVDANGSPWQIGGAIRPTTNDRIHKPVLKLAVITKLQESQSVTVPYLEYQILASAGVGFQPTDTSQTIKSEGYSGSFKQVLEVKQPQESGLLEYVIQQ
ncbi:MAG TPA: hypothetical protein VI588_01780 [Candidatus Gracilibacteria bacterium]|nr:hypothetical protein [Candidatus Gracilibacteria bacterium]